MDPFTSMIIARQQYERLAAVSRAYHVSGVPNRRRHAGQKHRALQISAQLLQAANNWWSPIRPGGWVRHISSKVLTVLRRTVPEGARRAV
jgi:hypothetical protein